MPSGAALLNATQLAIMEEMLFGADAPTTDPTRDATEDVLIESVTYPAFNVSNVTYYGPEEYGGQRGMVRCCACYSLHCFTRTGASLRQILCLAHALPADSIVHAVCP